MKQVFFAIAVTLLAGSNSALACYAFPDSGIRSYIELVARKESIVLAKVEATLAHHKTGEYQYGFKTIRVIKGEPVSHFIVVGSPRESTQNLEDTFDDHKSAEFWAFPGRLRAAGSCYYTPSFEVGATYLVFRGKPYVAASFERIKSDDDLWLQTIEKIASYNLIIESDDK